MLTREQILAAPPGRELDALVAQARGWRWVRGDHYDVCSQEGRQVHLLPPGEGVDEQRPGEFFFFDEQYAHRLDERYRVVKPAMPEGALFRVGWSHLPNVSTDIAAAWPLTEDESLAEDGFHVHYWTVEQDGLGYHVDVRYWSADATKRRGVVRCCPGETAPLAISRAYLLVKLEG